MPYPSIKKLGPCLLVALLVACGVWAQAANSPNIIYILADDVGYGDLSCYGQERFHTPVLDRMAGEGMRFTAHYSGSCVCVPARYTLMTGKHIARARTERRGQQLRPEDFINRYKEALYRLDKDPGEENDLAGRYPERAKYLAEQLNRYERWK